MRILYIENDKLSGLAFKINLSDHDIHVTHNREMGIKLAHLCHYDFILINYKLCAQEINGVHFLSEIKKNLFESSDPTFIAIVGNSDVFDAKRLFEPGFNLIIRKPISYVEFRSLIETKKKI